ncbi:Histone-lysine N-methyltransferase SETMAR [Octopus vulgaris]|uniref:Histone-lysine N-methyltransferase SETMAR n=1 Tax=Octopus vulgaris TaxID=6645 RepID=A0AA36BIE5_OCTVU|nr:Histone-lysine N-methyltransferase SETMAR [Octopus vulgaris]
MQFQLIAAEFQLSWFEAKDILEEDRAVTMEDGKKLADEWEIPFLEVSAKTDEVTTKDIKGSRIIKMECQVKKNEYFRHLLLFAFNQGSKAEKAAGDICAMYGEGAIAERTACDWYAKFKNGNFDLSI